MAAGCLSGQPGFKNMDVEAAEATKSLNPEAPTRRPAGSRLGVLLGLAGLLLGLTALAVSIYAAVKVGQLDNQGASSTSTYLRPTAGGYQIVSGDGSMDAALIGSSAKGAPAGYQFGGHLFQGTGYHAQLSPMLYSRSDHKTKPVGEDVYIIGGQSNVEDLTNAAPNATEADLSVLLDRLVRYSTYTENSFELRRMPEPRSRHAAVVLGNEIYVIGGVNQKLDDPPRPLPASVLKYSIATNTWTALTSGLNTPRSDACAEVMGNKIYVFGGYDKDYNDLATTEVYDPATGRWTYAANMPTSRGDCEAAPVSDDCLLVLGGTSNANGFLSTVECYNPRTDSWSTRTNMTLPRGDFAAEALPGGRVIVMGGEGNLGIPGFREYATHEVEEYIAADDVWVPKAQLAQGRFRFDTAHVGDRVYVFGGHPTCSSDAVAVADDGRQACVAVALDTVWAYFDQQYPNAYIYTKAA